MLVLLKTLALWIAACGLILLGLCVPAQMHSVDSRVLAYAGQQGLSPKQTAWDALATANVGVAQKLCDASLNHERDRRALTQQINALYDTNPHYRLSGGPAPVFEPFLERIQWPLPTEHHRHAVLSALLPRANRTLLADQLAASSHRHVVHILRIRNLRGLLRLHPADHPAGAPFDSGVLTLALLMQSEAFNPSLAREIGTLAQQAHDSQPRAVKAMEDLVIATLSIAGHMDFRSLSALAARTQNLDDWASIAALIRADPEHIATIFSSLYHSRAPKLVYDYYAKHPTTAVADLNYALSHGPAAVQYLLETGQVRYRPPVLLKQALRVAAPYRPQWFVKITHHSAMGGRLLKFTLLLAGGFCFTWAMGALWRSRLQRYSQPVSRHNPAVLMRDSLLSLALVLTVWFLHEPELLKTQLGSSAGASPRIEFAVADSLQSLQTPIKAMQEINQVTLLVLILFFIIQLVIYSFCLIKLREIEKQQLNAELKLKLLDNEDNLFDFGLYVGLGGTVLSLIMVAIGLVEASLMAAYASTLFGILFVALLKVLHLRPYRRKLIMAAESSYSVLQPSVGHPENGN